MTALTAPTADRSGRGDDGADAATSDGPSGPSGIRDRLGAFARWSVPPLVVALPLLWWFLAFHPAVMTSDSLFIWKQATQGQVEDGGSPLYIGIAWLSSLVVASPALLVVGQILLLSVSFCEIARALIRLGVPRWFMWPVTFVAACQPTVGAFGVQMWKDVPYSACLLLLVAAMLRLVASRAEGAVRLYELRVLYVAGTLVMLFRQNGILVVGAVGVLALLVFGRGFRRPILVVLIGALATFGFIRVVGYRVAGVEPAPAWLSVAWMASDIANVYESHPQTFEPDDLALMSSMLPLESWRIGADCYTLDFLIYGEPLDTEVLGERRDEIADLWWEVLREQPGAVLEQHVCAASIAWRPMSVHDSISVMYTVSAGIDPNDLGLSSDPIVDEANEWAIDVLRLWDDRSWHWITFRAATWIYPTYAVAAALALRRRSLVWLAPVAPMLAQQASLFVVNPAQDARYMIASLFTAYLLIPGLGWLLLAPRRRWVRGSMR